MPKSRENALKKNLPALNGIPAVKLMRPSVPDERKMMLVSKFHVKGSMLKWEIHTL